MLLQKERQVVMDHIDIAQFVKHKVHASIMCICKYICKGLVLLPVSLLNNISCHEGINQMHPAVPRSHYETLWPIDAVNT